MLKLVLLVVCAYFALTHASAIETFVENDADKYNVETPLVKDGQPTVGFSAMKQYFKDVSNHVKRDPIDIDVGSGKKYRVSAYINSERTDVINFQAIPEDVSKMTETSHNCLSLDLDPQCHISSLGQTDHSDDCYLKGKTLTLMAFQVCAALATENIYPVQKIYLDDHAEIYCANDKKNRAKSQLYLSPIQIYKRGQYYYEEQIDILPQVKDQPQTTKDICTKKAELFQLISTMKATEFEKLFSKELQPTWKTLKNFAVPKISLFKKILHALNPMAEKPKEKPIAFSDLTVPQFITVLFGSLSKKGVNVDADTCAAFKDFHKSVLKAPDCDAKNPTCLKLQALSKDIMNIKRFTRQITDPTKHQTCQDIIGGQPQR